MKALSTAQQVRLWFIAGIGALSLILAMIAAFSFNYYPGGFYTETPGITAASGDLIGVLGWLLVLLVAMITLGAITFVRFLHPRVPQADGDRPGTPGSTPRPTEPRDTVGPITR
jgi:hypothetical protein